MNFQEAADRVKTLPTRPSDDEMLRLYGLYKQATEGDITSERPGFWNLVKKAKWDSWKSFEGYDVKTAKKEYINTVLELISKYT